VEKQASIVYTHGVFKKLQEEVVAARDHCSVVGITQVESGKHVAITDGSEKRDGLFTGSHYIILGHAHVSCSRG
jgi:hypothetical protein